MNTYKKSNNEVLAVDISETALKIARERYPDIYFEAANVSSIEVLKNLFGKFGKTDLVFTSEVFSYIENWKEVLAEISNHSQFFLISLYLPENPIGFVKSENELKDSVQEHFDILEHVSLVNRKMVVFFAKSRNI